MLYQAYKAIAEHWISEARYSAEKSLLITRVLWFSIVRGSKLASATTRFEFKKLFTENDRTYRKFEGKILAGCHSRLAVSWSLTSLYFRILPPFYYRKWPSKMANVKVREGLVILPGFSFLFMPVMSYADNVITWRNVYRLCYQGSDQRPECLVNGITLEVMLDNSGILLIRGWPNLLGLPIMQSVHLATKWPNHHTGFWISAGIWPSVSKPLLKGICRITRLSLKIHRRIRSNWKPGMSPILQKKLRQPRYSISQEELKPYFPENKCVNGCLRWFNRLYGLDIRGT